MAMGGTKSAWSYVAGAAGAALEAVGAATVAGLGGISPDAHVWGPGEGSEPATDHGPWQDFIPGKGK